MFSLIITIISVALVAALALATLHYGGGAYNSFQVKSKASEIVSQANLVHGAMAHFRSEEGMHVTDAAALAKYGVSTPLEVLVASERLTSSFVNRGLDPAIASRGWTVMPVSSGRSYPSLRLRVNQKVTDPDTGAESFVSTAGGDLGKAVCLHLVRQADPAATEIPKTWGTGKAVSCYQSNDLDLNIDFMAP